MQERVKTQNVSYAQPSFGRQLMGLAGTAAGIYGMGGGKAFGGSGFSAGNLFGNMLGRAPYGYGGSQGLGYMPGRREGGKVYADAGGGLASLPIVYREEGGGGRSTFRRQAGEFISNIKDEQERVREERNIREKVTPLDLMYSYFARSEPEHQKRLDIYNERRNEAGADFDLGRGFPPVSEDTTTAAAIPTTTTTTTTTPAVVEQIDEPGGYSGLDTLQAQSAAKQDDVAASPQVRQTTGTDLLNEGLGALFADPEPPDILVK